MASDSKMPGGWRRVGYTDLYNECVSKGHKPYVHSTSSRSVYLHCPDCVGFWRIEVDRLTWMPLSEWLGKPPR